jgi:hypothetical protein
VQPSYFKPHLSINIQNVQRASWLDITYMSHKNTEQSTLDGVTLTDSLLRWSPNEWPSVCWNIPVSVDKMFWTSNKLAKWTPYTFLYHTAISTEQTFSWEAYSPSVTQGIILFYETKSCIKLLGYHDDEQDEIYQTMRCHISKHLKDSASGTHPELDEPSPHLLTSL